MNVGQLIEALRQMPANAPVGVYVEGGVRIAPAKVWKVECDRAVWGAPFRVILAKEGETIYDDSDRPPSAPRESAEKYWTLPERGPVVLR